MCAICRKIPCDFRCPNAPERKIVHICAECRDDIFEGEKFFDSQRGAICKNCMDDMITDDVLELLGESYSVAETEDAYDL